MYCVNELYTGYLVRFVNLIPFTFRLIDQLVFQIKLTAQEEVALELRASQVAFLLSIYYFILLTPSLILFSS